MRARYVRVVSEPSLFVCSIVKHDQEEIALEVGCEPSLATSLAVSMGPDLRAVVGEQKKPMSHSKAKVVIGGRTRKPKQRSERRAWESPKSVCVREQERKRER